MNTPYLSLVLPSVLLTVLLAFAAPVLCIAQERTDASPSEILFYDADWKLVTDRKKAEYIRHLFKTQNSELVLIKDFFKSGELQEECQVSEYDSRNGLSIAREGKCKLYGPDGGLRAETEFKKGRKDGLSRELNDEGIWEVGYYVSGEKQGLFNYLDAEGVLKAQMSYTAGVTDKLGVFCPDEGCFAGYLENFASQITANFRDWTFDESAGFLDPKGLLVELSPENDSYQTNALGLDPKNLWTISTDFRFPERKGTIEHGLFFGANGIDNLILFTIASDGTFSIRDRRNTVEKPIVEKQKSNAIKRGDEVNEIQVTSSDEGFEFTINDEVVHKQEELRWHGGEAGLISMKGRGQVVTQGFAYIYPTERPVVTEIKPAAWWTSTGSGFLLSRQGFIVTNHHVIDGVTKVEVDLKKGDEVKSVPAEVIAFDAASDLAILKISSEELMHVKEIPFSVRSELVDLGTKVFTLGFPATDVLGTELKFSEGSVSARSGYMGDVTSYQISVPLQGGNSGGPLFDIDGNLIGVINANVPALQNVGYGIKASYLVDMIKSIDNGPTIPTENRLKSMPQTERIKALSELMVFIKVKD